MLVGFCEFKKMNRTHRINPASLSCDHRCLTNVNNKFGKDKKAVFAVLFLTLNHKQGRSSPSDCAGKSPPKTINTGYRTPGLRHGYVGTAWDRTESVPANRGIPPATDALESVYKPNLLRKWFGMDSLIGRARIAFGDASSHGF